MTLRTALLAVFLFVATSLTAQVQQSSVDGTAADVSRAALPGVTIELRDPATGYMRVTTTDAAGRFRIVNVPPGLYELTASLAGFVEVRSEVGLAVGETAHLNVAMRVESIAETVDVTAASSGLDTTATAPQAVVDTERIEELPVQSRNYLDFVLLAPGVVPSGQRSAARPGAPDSGFSFAGQRPRSNVLTIDGLSNNDEYSGAARTELSLETVREFDVVSHGAAAESGTGAGGSINVVTKSGSNVIHGDAFVFLQNGRLDARPFDERSKPPLQRYRTGGAIGGPIVRDRTFYYAAAEYESSRSTVPPEIDPAAAALINRMVMSLQPSVLPLLSNDPSPTSRREVELSAKLNHQLTPATALVAKVASNDNREEGGHFDYGIPVDRSARGSARTNDVAVTATLSSIYGEKATNDVRVQVAERSIETSAAGAGAAIRIAGVAAFGSPYGATGDHRQRYLELGDTAVLARGDHLVRIGADLTRMRVTGEQSTGGMYLFRSLQAFEAGTPDAYRQTFGATGTTIEAARYSGFVQDDWTRGALTLNAGVRFDSERLPQSLHVSNALLQPRVGLAWAPASSWVVRASGGIFADRIPLAAIERPLTIEGASAFEEIFAAPDAAAVFTSTRGGLLASPSASVSRSRYAARAGSWNPQSRQFSVSAEHAFTPVLSASLSLLHSEGRNLLRTMNTSPANPATGDVLEVQPTAASRYTGATLAVNQRMMDEVEWSASYTVSKAMDDASDFDEQPADPRNLAAEWAPALADQRHRVTFSALFELEDEGADGGATRWWSAAARNVEIAPTFVFATGGRANPLTGLDVTHAWPLSARPAGYERNSLRLPSTTSLNLRIVKYVPFQPHGRVDLVVEAFNVLNRRNVRELGVQRGADAQPAATFGRPIRMADARQVQFSLDVEF